MRHFAVLPPLALTLLLVAGCTMGPDYQGPPKPLASGAVAGPFARGGAAVQPAAPVAARWWSVLGDATLDSLETRALAASPNLALAQARVRQARGSLRLERANAAPSLSAMGAYAHAEAPGISLQQRPSGETGASADRTSLDFYNAALDASWEIDLFGGRRRSTEAARAAVEAAEANLADAQVQLTADVAQAYVNLRDRQQRRALAQRAAEMQRQMLELVRQRQSRGAASALDVERLQGQVRATEAQLVPIDAEIAAFMNALAVLTGVQPGALDGELRAPAPIPLPPATVAVGDPESLLRRRPDVRAAERSLAAQTAKIGVAEAARFPRLSFMGLLGLGGTSPADLVDIDKVVALAAPQLQWNFADFGRGGARVEQAQGARDEAEAQYRRAVLNALKDAEDSLARFAAQRDNVAALARVKASADRASALMQQRYRAGTATLIDALDAERQRLAADQNLAQATAMLTADFVAVHKALGLGWDDGGR